VPECPPRFRQGLFAADEAGRLGGEIGERNLSRYPQLQAAAGYIETQLTESGWKLRRDEYAVQGKSCYNIEAELRGASPEIVLIGAHYDSVFGAPGANDNGSGVATFTTSTLTAGSHIIRACYAGTGIFTASNGSVTQTVNKGATTTTVSSSAPTSVFGQSVTFTATVRDPSGTGTPTGTVTFFVGNTVVARVTLDANGQARLRGSFSVAGRFTIRAVYSGDATFDASSQFLTEQVIR
jgi:hypothetical protein